MDGQALRKITDSSFIKAQLAVLHICHLSTSPTAFARKA
jgi:hypothetical protein